MFKFTESKPGFFFCGKFYESKTTVIARVHFLGQSNLLNVAERLEKLSNLIRCCLESQVFD